MIYFFVQGSAKKPYRVTFEGAGASLRSFCTCPAFSRGGYFCKHVSALLVGDVTNLTGGDENLKILQPRSEGSPLLSDALLHQPAASKRHPSSINTLDAALIHIARRSKDKNFVLMSIDPDDYDKNRGGISIHKIGKHGKPLKQPIASFCYSEARLETHFVMATDGELREVTTAVPRARNWVVLRGNHASSFSSCGAAVAALDEWFENI